MQVKGLKHYDLNMRHINYINYIFIAYLEGTFLKRHLENKSFFHRNIKSVVEWQTLAIELA